MLEVKILFQNEYFVVVDKPAQMLSTPSRMGAEDARKVLGIYLQNLLGKQIFPVHRLDFEVSGVILYALSAEAHRVANKWFENRIVHKTYGALTTGRSTEHLPSNVKGVDLGTTYQKDQNYIWKNRITRGKKRSYYSPHGDPSETRATYLGMNPEGFHQWKLEPVTGRSHQLRLDLSLRGYPIVGDSLYGSISTYKPHEIALRCFMLDFSGIQEAERKGLPERIEVEYE